MFWNFSSLSLLQISQYLLPLITFPYLVRVLGPDGYGLVNFAAAFVGYFAIVTDYGFNLSATRNISINRDDKKKLSEIFSTVMAVKLILAVLSFIIVVPLVFSFIKFSKDYDIYLISFIAVIGTSMFPVWFFQGVEKMGYISLISIGLKILWVIAVFIFITSYNDIVLLVIFNALSSISSAVIGVYFVYNKFKINLILPNRKQIVNQFKDGFHYFLSQFSISLYTISNVFILGLFASHATVGYFTAADKIRNAVNNLSSVSGTTIFPHLSNEFKRSKEVAIRFLKKYVITLGTFTFVLSALLFVFAEQIVYLVLGQAYSPSILILKIISFLPFIIFLSNVAGIQTMLNLGYKREFAKIITAAGIFNIIGSFLVVPYYLSTGTAVMLLITELLVTIMMLMFLKQKKIYLFRKILSEI